MAIKFFLDDIFNDTENSEVVLYASEIDRYFTLKHYSLSYTYCEINSDIALIQWSFIGKRLIIEDHKGFYKIELVSRNGNELLVDIYRISNKAVISVTRTKLLIIDEVHSSSLESLQLKNRQQPSRIFYIKTRAELIRFSIQAIAVLITLILFCLL